MADQTLKDKIRNSNPFSGNLVPIFLVLLAMLLIVAITKLLREERGYVELIEELEQKTFGNRWVAAFELSKYLSSSAIPKSELPWLLGKLTELYDQNTQDPRTRQFLVVSAASTKHPAALALLIKGLADPDSQTRFSSLSSLALLPRDLAASIPVAQLEALLSHEDPGLVQAAIAVLHYFSLIQTKDSILKVLTGFADKHPSEIIRLTSSIALIPNCNQQCQKQLHRIVQWKFKSQNSSLPLENLSSAKSGALDLNDLAIESLQMNLIMGLKKVFAGASDEVQPPSNLASNSDWEAVYRPLVEQLEELTQSEQVKVQAKSLLLLLKK